MLRRVIKLLFSRLFWFAIGIIIQLAALIFLVFQVSNYQYVYYGFVIFNAIMAIFVVTRDENPAYRMAWLLLMCAVPFVGLLLYIIFGNKKIGHRASRSLIRYRERLDQSILYDEKTMNDLITRDSRFSRQLEYIYSASRYGVWKDTSALYFSDAKEFIEDLVTEVEKAEKFIFIEYFIIGRGKVWDRLLEILKRKAAEGVRIRILYDDMGSINVLPRHYDSELRSYGFEAYAFNPVRAHLNPRLNYRDHRKIFDIDGNVCYTGGLNLADEYTNDIVRFGVWKDNAVKLTGQAVWSLTVMFLLNWYSVSGSRDELEAFRPTLKAPSDGFIQPFGDSPFDDVSVARNAYMQVINNARRYVWIVTPYLILDNEMITALQIAAGSGVDVRIITPFYADKKSVHEVTRSYYPSLIESGVKIYEYLPGFIHSKTLISDDEVAFVGTANLDYRSFYLHFELSILFLDSSVVAAVKDDTINALEHSHEMTTPEVEDISFPHRLLRTFFGIFAPAL